MMTAKDFYRRNRNWGVLVLLAGVVLTYSGGAYLGRDTFGGRDAQFGAVAGGILLGLMGLALLFYALLGAWQWQRRCEQKAPLLEWTVPRRLLTETQLAYAKRVAALMRSPLAVVGVFVLVAVMAHGLFGVFLATSWQGEGLVKTFVVFGIAEVGIQGALLLDVWRLQRALGQAATDDCQLRVYEFGVEIDSRPILLNAGTWRKLYFIHYRRKGIAAGYGVLEIEWTMGGVGLPYPLAEEETLLTRLSVEVQSDED